MNSDRASSWWDDQGPFWLLHQWMPLRMDFIHRQLARAYAGWLKTESIAIVDVGCGGGLVSQPLARQGALVWGIDPDDQAIACAIAHQNATYPDTNLHYVCADPLQWTCPVPAQVVILFEVLEHVAHPQALIEHVMSWLAPNGLILGSTIHQTAWSALTAITLAQDLLAWVPDHLHTWEKFIPPSALQTMIQPYTPHPLVTQGCMYYPGVGWRYVASCAGHYFFVIQS